MIRLKQGREASPSLGIIDSQSIKTCYAGEEIGYDAGKRIKGRKRHILVDTQGNLLSVVVHSASLQDRVGGKLVIDECKGQFPRLQVILADGAYQGKIQPYCHARLGALMQIVQRDKLKEFVVIPKRWIVERTLAWLNNYRRLSKDYEATISSSRAWILIADIRRIIRKLAKL